MHMGFVCPMNRFPEEEEEEKEEGTTATLAQDTKIEGRSPRSLFLANRQLG